MVSSMGAMRWKRFPSLTVMCVCAGLVLLAGGVGMRVYAALTIAVTGQRLLAARPSFPLADDRAARLADPFTPADGPPTQIRLPDLGLWNDLQPVAQQVTWRDGQIDAAWEVRDAGWHSPSGWPGYGRNVVIAGHSPSRDPGVWSRSIFRQLAYLNAGDRLELRAGTRIYTYAVSRVFAIPAGEADTETAASWIRADAVDTPSGERLTLVTCWPPNTAAYRVLVIAFPVKSSEVSDEQ
jgi:LPXTG-site transpeptidase (sortase) family protein